MKSKEELYEKMNKESTEFYANILNIKNSFESINKKVNDKKNHYLISKTFYEEKKNFVENVKNFIILLWDNPKIMYKIILKTDINDINNNLFPSLINNFYENIFSSNIIENQLLYIFILFLDDEINGIKSLDEKNNFLENEILINFINEFIKKPEIQNFIRFIIQDIINDINKKTNEKYMNENYYESSNKINLDVLKIETIINKTIKEKEEEEEQKEREKEKKRIIRKAMESTKSSYSILKEPNNNDEDNFSEIKKYFDDITMAVLEKNSLNDKSSKNFKDFCSKQLK